MDGKGRYLDNILVERLWRSLKYEEVYLKTYQSGKEARQGINDYLDFYNRERPHQALDYRTPGRVFGEGQSRRYLPEQEMDVPWRQKDSLDIHRCDGPTLEKIEFPGMVGALQINRPAHSGLQGHSKLCQIHHLAILKSWAGL